MGFFTTKYLDIGPEFVFNSYGFFKHRAAYASPNPTAFSTFPDYTSIPPDSGIKFQLIVGSVDSIYVDALLGNDLDFSATPEQEFELLEGTLTGFATGLGTDGTLETAEAFVDSISIPAAQFFALTKANAWHDIFVLAAADDDSMNGSSFHDFIEGWNGSDELIGNAGDDSLWGNAGGDILYGNEGNDILVGNDWAAGGTSAFWDACWGGSGDDLLFSGGYGSGYLVGEDGVDRIWGAGQSDVLVGGRGSDYLAGGGGLDLFTVNAADMVAGEIDTIMDFQDGLDFIKLSPGTIYSLSDSAYGAFLSVGVAGGTWGMIVQYNTAAQIADQIYLAA
jgi:Ca2+-binding RTX toxin-like protein